MGFLLSQHSPVYFSELSLSIDALDEFIQILITQQAKNQTQNEKKSDIQGAYCKYKQQQSDRIHKGNLMAHSLLSTNLTATNGSCDMYQQL
jgi:hypothetical protein